MTTVATPRIVASVVTVPDILDAGSHTPVDATAGAITMTLPTQGSAGAHLSVAKHNTNSNVVNIVGNIEGVVGSSRVLTTSKEMLEFTRDANGSWWVTGGNRTKAALDAAYAAYGSVGGGTPGPTGLSAYELAVAAGYSGTQSAWLLSLKGASGTNGTNGTNGLNGTNGTNGSNGVAGPPGPQGVAVSAPYAVSYPPDTVLYKSNSWGTRPPTAGSVQWVCATNATPAPVGALPGDTVVRPSVYTPPPGYNFRHDGDAGQPDGTPVTIPNTAVVRNTIFDNVITEDGASVTYSTQHPITGATTGFKFSTQATGFTGYSGFLEWTIPWTTNTIYVRGYIYLTAELAASITPIVIRSSTGNAARIRIRTDRKLACLGGSSTELNRTTAAIPLNTLVRIEAQIIMSNTAGGQVNASFYTGESTTATDTVTNTGVDTGANSAVGVRFGISISAAATAPFWMGGLAAGDASYRGPSSLDVLDSGIRDSATSLIALPVFGTYPDPTPTLLPVWPTGPVIASFEEIMSFPTTGNGYANAQIIRTLLLTNPTPSLDITDNRVGAIALTGALLWYRTGQTDAALLASVKQYILAAPGTWNATTTQALNPGRSLGALFAAVDILMKAGVWSNTATCPNDGNRTWLDWITGLETRVLAAGNTRWSVMKTIAVDSGNNWGAVFRYATLMLGVIRQDATLVQQCVDHFRRYCGETWKGVPYNQTASYLASWDNTGAIAGKVNAGIGFVDQNTPGRDGALVEDVNRGLTDFNPALPYYGDATSGLSYPLVAADNVWGEVAALEHLGYPARQYGNFAVMRMMDWLHRAQAYSTGIDVYRYLEINNSPNYLNHRWTANRFRGGKPYGTPVATTSSVDGASLPRALTFGDWMCAETSTWMSQAP